MGEVYLAQHPRLPRRDALKLLTGDVTADPTFRERFLREADLASTLWHPHIVGVHDRGEYGGRLWISMIYVDGQDAASLLARKYPAGMPVALVSSIVSGVASALDYAHRKGLLHRDVKPSNILIPHHDEGEEQRALLTDFGIARTIDDSSGLTDTNMTVGTVDYAAPEQLMGQEIAGRADQYSLAATTYHLLTGAPPFLDSNAAVVIGRHLNMAPPSLAAARPELEPLDDVLAAGLAKNPDERFASCSDFARAFNEQASGSARTSAPAAPTTPAPIRHTFKTSEQLQLSGPLAPGWYPDPSGKHGTLYWNGREWHSAAMPKVERPSDVSNKGEAKDRWGLWLFITGIAGAAAVSLGAFAFIATRDAGPSAPTASPGSSLPEPTFVTGLPPRSTSPTTSLMTPPPAHTETVTVTPPAPPPPLPSVPYWTATIVGTCDEGGSCGVKQREAPYVDAERLYPSDLKDGMLINVVCYTRGDPRTNSGHGSSDVWYQLINGAYVNVVYTTLKAPVGMPAC